MVASSSLSTSPLQASSIPPSSYVNDNDDSSSNGDVVFVIGGTTSRGAEEEEQQQRAAVGCDVADGSIGTTNITTDSTISNVSIQDTINASTTVDCVDDEEQVQQQDENEVIAEPFALPVYDSDDVITMSNDTPHARDTWTTTSSSNTESTTGTVSDPVETATKEDSHKPTSNNRATNDVTSDETTTDGGPLLSDFDKFVKDHCDPETNKIPNKDVEEYLRELLKDLQKAPPPSPTPQASSNDSIYVSRDGIHLKWFDEVFMNLPEVEIFIQAGCPMWFLREYGIREILRRRGIHSGSVTDNMHVFDADRTSNSRDSNNNKRRRLEVSSYKNIQKAKTFISFTGSYTIQHFMDSLRVHQKECPEDKQYVWIDTFCVDQFAWMTRSKEYMEGFTKDLEMMIYEIGNTVLMLDSWDDIMKTLNQIWVLFEVYITSTGRENCKPKFSILLNDTQLAKFEDELLINENVSKVGDVLAMVNAEHAQGKNEQEMELIKNRISKEGGYHNVNQNVCQQIRKWIITKANKIVTTYSNKFGNESRQTQIATIVLANLHRQQGQYDKAEELLRSASEHVNNDDKNMQLCMNNQLGLILYLKRNDEEAEKILKKYVKETNKTDKYYLNYLHDLFKVSVRIDTTPDDNIKQMYKELLDGCKTNQNALDQMFTMQEYATWLKDKKEDYNEAIKIYQHVIEYYENKWGEKHTHTLNTLHNCGTALINRFKKNTLNQNHSSISSIIMKDLNDAETYFQRSLKGNLEIYGVRHEESFNSMSCLGYTQYLQQRCVEAERTLFDAFEGQSELLGDDHGNTVITMRRLVVVYRDLYRNDKFDENMKERAKLFLSKEFRHHSTKYGMDDSDTKKILECYYECIYQNNNGQELSDFEIDRVVNEMLDKC